MKVAQSGSFRSIRPYGLTDISSYLRSLRIAKQEAEDAYWNAALEDGSEKAEDILTYWEGQRDRFEPGTVDYKTYQAKIERIKTTIDTNKVSSLIAENKYDDAIKYFQTKVLSKYEKDSPAWSEAFVNLQKIKEAKVNYEIGLQEAKLRAKYSPGGLSGSNLVNYYSEMLKYMEDSDYTDREEYFKLIEGQNTAIAQAEETERKKEEAAFNRRLNELVNQKSAEKGAALNWGDYASIYSQLSSEFSRGSSNYTLAVTKLAEAQEKQRVEEENIRKLEFNTLYNQVMSQYASGGITDSEMAAGLQELLTLATPGSEEYVNVARALGQLQESLAGKAKAASLEETRQQIALLEEQEYQRQQGSLINRLTGKMTSEEEDEARQKFLEQIVPLYEQAGSGKEDMRTLAQYQVEAVDLPKQREQRKQGKLVDQVIRGEGGAIEIVPILLEDLVLGGDKPINLEVITDKGVERFTFNPETQAWTNPDTKEKFATIPTTSDVRENYMIPTTLSDKETKERISQLKEAEKSGQEFNPQDILGVITEQKKPWDILPTISTVIEKGKETGLLGIGQPSPFTLSLPSFEIPELKLPSFGDIEKTVGSIIEKGKETGLLGIGQPSPFTLSLPSLPSLSSIGQTISGAAQKVTEKAKDIWGGLTSSLSKLKFW